MRCDRCTVWGKQWRRDGRTDRPWRVIRHVAWFALFSVVMCRHHCLSCRHASSSPSRCRLTMQSSTRSDSVCSAAAAPRDAGSELLLYTIGLFHFQYSQLTIIHLELLSPVCVLFLFAFQSVYLWSLPLFKKCKYSCESCHVAIVDHVGRGYFAWWIDWSRATS